MASAQEQRYDFAFDRRFGPLLGLLGIRPDTSYVLVTDEELRVRFGPWEVVTSLSNLASVQVSGPYAVLKGIGVRVSLTDRGLTFGSSLQQGVCLRFRQPIGGSEPVGLLHHPSLTVTVADCPELAALLRRHIRTSP